MKTYVKVSKKTTYVFPSRAVFTRSKAVEHARGWVATRMGLLDIINSAARITTRDR